MEEERWIEAESLITDEHETNDVDIGGLFDDPDPYDEFVFDFSTRQDDNDNKDDDKKKDGGASLYRIVLHGIKQENGQTLSSTGMTLWRAAPLLCRFLLLHRRSVVQGKRVLELGSGLGLCGILASQMGASRVVLTDGDTDTLAQLRTNVHNNNNKQDNNSIVVQQLCWGQRLDVFQQHFGKFDLILGADIIYVESILEPLFETVVRLLDENNNKGRFCLAYARRNVSIDLVLECATRFQLTWTTEPVPHDDDNDNNINNDYPHNRGECVYVFSRMK